MPEALLRAFPGSAGNPKENLAEMLERLAKELQAVRRREIREADNLKVLESLEHAFNHAIRALPPRPSSWLVEMHAWFEKLRK
jgi:hypothetical protein